MVEFGTSSIFREWVRVRVLGYGSGVRGRKVKSRDCALACQTLPGLPRAARPSGRFAEGKTPQRRLEYIEYILVST